MGYVMKRLGISVFTILLAITCAPLFAQNSTAPAAPPATSWKQVAIPQLPPFKPQPPKRIVLANGLVIFLTENHELPFISGNAMIRGGADSEPASKTGLVEIYGGTWRTGGTEKLSGDQLDDLLEARAAKVETAGSEANTTINFNCLKGDFTDVFGVFVDLLRHPAFREEKLALAKKQLDSNISRRNDETDEIASEQQDILGYGRQSALARQAEYATVAAVTRQDLLDWHKQHVAPNNIILGIVGDFDSHEMEATLRKAFGEWPKGVKVAEAKPVIAPEKPGLYLVDKTDVNQSEIRMIAPGIVRRNPDYFALKVMNEIFGGGFSSRLFSNLRTKAGLAYSVGGGVGAEWDHPGLTALQIGTKTESTIDAIRGLWEQIDLLKQQPPSEEELKRAKDAILNSFIFNFDTPAKVLREQQTYEFYGYPANFLDTYRAGVEKVTTADVARVANQYLHRDQMRVLVVGNASEFRNKLAELGPVTTLDITIPEAPEAAAPAAPKAGAAAPAPPAAGTTPAASGTAPAGGAASPAASNPEGRAAVKKLLEYLGGAAKVAPIHSLRQSITMEQEGAEMKIVQEIIYPDRLSQKMQMSQGDVYQVITPQAAFLRMGSQIRDLPGSAKKVELDNLKHDFLAVLQHLDDAAYTFTASGTETVDGVTATIVDVNADGAKTRWWIAPDGRLIQERSTNVGRNGPSSSTMVYSAWKAYDGLRYPTHYEITGAAEGDKSTMTLNELELNPAIDPAVFVKPAPPAN